MTKLIAITTMITCVILSFANPYGNRDAIAQNHMPPLKVSLDPSQPSAQQAVTITVEMSSSVSYDRTVSLSASSSSAYSSLPGSVTIPANEIEGSVSATIGASPPSTFITYATNAHGSTSVTTLVNPGQ
jgi:hypothetical protein